MNVHWFLLFVGVLVIIFDSVQIDSYSSTMSKTKRKRATKASNKKECKETRWYMEQGEGKKEATNIS